MISAVLIIVIGAEESVCPADVVEPSGETDIVVERGHFLIPQLGVPVGTPDSAQEYNSVPGEKFAGLKIGFQGFLYGFKAMGGRQLSARYYLSADLSFPEDFYRVNRAADPFISANIFFLAGTQEGEELSLIHISMTGIWK